MQEIYDYIDEYVKLSYVARRLNAKLHRLPVFMYASSVVCNYRSLGLSEEIIAKLEGETSLQELKDCFKVLSEKVDSMSTEIYGTIQVLSPDLKVNLYNYLLGKSASLTAEAGAVQNAYMKTIGQIEYAEKKDDSQQIRRLGKIAKTQYSRYYELDSFKNSYTYLGCYMSSMVNRKFEDDIKAENGLSLK